MSVCHLLFKMPELYRFIQVALATLKPDNSSLTSAMSTPTGHGLQNRHCADTTSVRPVQIAQEGEERQAIQYSTPSEGREELKEIKVGQRRCEISTTNAKSQQELLKEDFKESTEKTAFNESAKTTELTDYKEIEKDFAIKVKEDFKEERHYAQDRIDQAEKEAVAQNHSEQAETESTETEEDFNESTEEFTESAETEEFTESAETEEKTEELTESTTTEERSRVEETSNAKIKIRATDATKENEVFDDVTQMFNKQIRVEDSSRANVISLEQICKRQDCQGMVECSEAPGTNISPANYEV